MYKINPFTIEAHINACMYRMEHPDRKIYPCPAIPIPSEIKESYAHIGMNFWDMYSAFESDIFKEAEKRIQQGKTSIYSR
jgi:hypothetical protein